MEQFFTTSLSQFIINWSEISLQVAAWIFRPTVFMKINEVNIIKPIRIVVLKIDWINYSMNYINKLS